MARASTDRRDRQKGRMTYENPANLFPELSVRMNCYGNKSS